ncbi:MAG: AMP-binding protein, partial [Cyanobacteria bacterium J06631_9]
MRGVSAAGTSVNRLREHQQVNMTAVESLLSQDSGAVEATLLERLYWRAANQPEQVAYQFLIDQPVSVAESVVERWTYQELFQKVVQVASSLMTAFDGQPSARRLLLVYHPGLDFVAAFLGCLAAGVVAVPVPPPRRHESFSRWQHVLADADINGVLTSQSLREKVEELIESSHHVAESRVADGRPFCWLVTDNSDSDAVTLDPRLLLQKKASSSSPALQQRSAEKESALLALLRRQQHIRESVAFLQYTSGSTSQPKGVKVTNANLACNLEQIQRAFGHSEQTRCVIWLPPYHDMGLIGGILQPLYGGYPVTLMSPASFLRRPVRWLEAISHFGATTSGGPNFAYDYCVNKVSPKVLASLDLTSWSVAFTGAEPVQAKTLSRFSEFFSSCGFQSSAFYPCYGLAESTLFVSGGSHAAKPTKLLLDRQALLENRVKPVVETAVREEDAAQLVSCGQAATYQLKIVNPETRAICDHTEIGEVWLAGKSVAAGYWNRPEDTQETFSATVLGDPSTQFLRTGDLGFVHGGELFITGRLKEIIIIRGRNYYPQDIESQVVAAHPALATVNAAFSVATDEGEEKLIVAQEATRAAVRSLRKQALSAEDIFAAIRAAVSHAFSLPVAGIVLLKPGQIPRTTSGKIQRQRCRQFFVRSLSKSNTAQKSDQVECLQDEPAHWDVLAQWTAINTVINNESPGMSDAEQPENQEEQQTVDALIQWLRKAAREQINSRQMDERRCLSPDVVLAFGNQGLLGMQVPKVYGGLGLSHQSMLKILQQLGAIDLTLALFVGLNNVLGIRPILRYGSAQLKEKWLPLLASGRELAAFALTEASAGSHPVGMAAQATPTETGWYLRGEKIWSGSAAWAGAINVFVQQYNAQGHAMGISGFVVPQGSVGLRQGPEALTMGMRGMVQNTIFLEGVPVSSAQLLGAPGAGMSVAQDAMMQGRLGLAAG